MAEDRQVALRHPLYLDVPMMTSFLAYLQGGVAQTVEQIVTRTREATSSDEGGGELKISLPATLSLALSGKLGSSDTSAGTDEHKMQRQHTSASLFNLLLDLLTDSNLINSARTENLEDVAAGSLVRVNGIFVGNPLEKFLGFASQMIPFIEPEEPVEQPRPQSQARSGNPAKKPNAAKTPDYPLEALLAEQQKKEAASTRAMLGMIRQMHADATGSPVSDVLVRATDGLSVVVTASREFMTDAVAAQLESSQVSVIGKVTLVDGDEPVNLMRRTVFVLASESEGKGLFDNMPGLGTSAEHLYVKPPYLQIMPLAIFI